MVRVKTDPVIEISFEELKSKFSQIEERLSQGYLLHKFYVETQTKKTDKRMLIIKLMEK